MHTPALEQGWPLTIHLPLPRPSAVPRRQLWPSQPHCPPPPESQAPPRRFSLRLATHSHTASSSVGRCPLPPGPPAQWQQRGLRYWRRPCRHVSWPAAELPPAGSEIIRSGAGGGKRGIHHPGAASALKPLLAPVLPLRENLVSPTLVSLTKGPEPGSRATRDSGCRCQLWGPLAWAKPGSPRGPAETSHCSTPAKTDATAASLPAAPPHHPP